MKNKILKTLICVAPIIGGSMLTLPMVSCSSVKTIDIIGDDQINVNEKKQYKVIVNGKDCGNVKWNVVSSNQGQASIDENGELTGKIEGTVIIMVTYTKNGVDHLGFKDVEVTNDIKPIPFEYLDISGSTLNGFNGKATETALSQYNTLLIPSYVTEIGYDMPPEQCSGQVFCKDVDGDGAADTSLIPENIVNLRFETDENGISALRLIGTKTFLLAPIKSIVFPISSNPEGLTIQCQAFKGIGLEQCYFAPNIQRVEDEAFMNTKLEEVVFHNTEVGSLDEQLPPWLRKEQIISDYCVKYIGLHAFSGCPVKYHKVCVSPDSSNQIYQIDANGYGPFANIESPIPFSSIECLDLSDYHNDSQTKSLPSDCIKTFGINMNSVETEDITGHYVLYDDRDADTTFINKIRDAFKLSQVGSTDQTMIGNWNFAKVTQFNFAPIEPDNLYQPIEWVSYGDYPVLTFNSFYQVAGASIFAADLQTTFTNVEWGDGKSQGRQLYVEVNKDAYDNWIMMLKCKTDEEDSIMGVKVSFDVTFYSPGLHMSYTYGHHESVIDGEQPINNYMIAQF